MWRSKKFLLVALLVPAVLVGSISGVAFAQTENGEDSKPEARHEALLERVSEIYEENTGVTIDPQELQNAFAEAKGEMHEEAMHNHLQRLVDDGTLAQAQADQYSEWWESRPDIQLPPPPRFGPGPHGPGGPGPGLQPPEGDLAS